MLDIRERWTNELRHVNRNYQNYSTWRKKEERKEIEQKRYVEDKKKSNICVTGVPDVKESEEIFQKRTSRIFQI